MRSILRAVAIIMNANHEPTLRLTARDSVFVAQTDLRVIHALLHQHRNEHKNAKKGQILNHVALTSVVARSCRECLSYPVDRRFDRFEAA